MSDSNDYEDFEFFGDEEDEELKLAVNIVTHLSSTYRELCGEYHKTVFSPDAVLIDPPSFEDRLKLLLIAVDTHEHLLPDDFHGWLEDLITETMNVRGEIAADLYMCSLTSLPVSLVPFFSRCGGHD